MGQISFSDAEYAGKRKKTRREVFLEEMELVVPWKEFRMVVWSGIAWSSTECPFL
jgi:IS5 family transposase